MRDRLCELCGDRKATTSCYLMQFGLYACVECAEMATQKTAEMKFEIEGRSKPR